MARLIGSQCAMPGEHGKMMMEGEFSAMTELYKFAPTFIPEPYTWGKFESAPPSTYFFLLEFKDMTSKLPSPEPFCSELAKLHQTSVSPTGKFGFHIATTHGKLPQHMVWTSSWEAMFRKILSDLLLLDLDTNGPWKEFQHVYERILTLVLPKLIGPLESEGRTVKPCLLHGDLWHGNIGVDNKTGRTYIFDASSFYGHNELELGMWRDSHLNRMSWDVYGKEYLRTVGVSEPAQQFDDRNRIYHVKFLMWHSAHHPNDAARERYGDPERVHTESNRIIALTSSFSSAYENMQYLVDKYAPWPIDMMPGNRSR